MNATDLIDGTLAKVLRISGTPQFNSKLAAMGITPGSTITKKSSSLLNGPIIIEKGTTQLAIGHNFAKNIIVEPLK